MAAPAVAAECMVEPVRGDEQGAAEQGDGQFLVMRGQCVSPERGGRDAGEASHHKAEHGSAAMYAEAAQQSYGSAERDENGEDAVRVLLRWHPLREQCGAGDE